MRASLVSKALALSVLSAVSSAALAQQAGPGLPLVVAQGAGGTSYSVPIQTLLFFTALSFLPAVLLLMTGFTRIVIVLSLLRQALGTQAAPPNQVIIGLSLFLTFFVMGPTFDKVYDEAYKPFNENRINAEEAFKRGEVPLRAFMLKQTRQADVMLFARLAKLPQDTQAETVPLKVLVPAFVTSELKSGVPDRLHDLHPVSHHRHGRCQRADVARHDDVVAGARRPALQADAVRVGGWVESAARFARCFFRHVTHPIPNSIQPVRAEVSKPCSRRQALPSIPQGSRNSHLRANGTETQIDMDASQVFTAGQQGLWMLLMVSAPVLLVVLVVGLVVSVFQAATQINEATLSFVPKIIAAVVVLAVAGPWMMTTLVEYLQRTLQAIPGAVG